MISGGIGCSRTLTWLKDDVQWCCNV